MRPEDAKKLLGGYATGTLTEAEQEALFAAALDDQELFDALAQEQSLRETLRDPAVKAELLAALDDRPRQWWNWRPAAVLAVAGLAAVAVLMVRQQAPAPAIVAEVKAPAPQTPAPPGPKPVKTVRAQALEPAETKRGFERQPVTGPRASGAVAAPKPMSAMAPSAPSVSMLAQDAAPTPLRAEAKAQLRATSGALSARELFFLPPAPGVRLQAVADSAVRQTMALRYTVLRKEGAEFVDADPEGLKPDDTVALRFTANSNGFLSIDGATPVAITVMQPYTTPAVDEATVRVVFSRTPETAAESSVSTERQDRETFVVNRRPATAIAFTIALKRQ